MLDLKFENKEDLNFIGTIHSVKGKTFDAALLILSYQCINMLGDDLLDQDELRNVYVSMSRVKYYLEIVIPSKDLKR